MNSYMCRTSFERSDYPGERDVKVLCLRCHGSAALMPGTKDYFVFRENPDGWLAYLRKKNSRLETAVGHRQKSAGGWLVTLWLCHAQRDIII